MSPVSVKRTVGNPQRGAAQPPGTKRKEEEGKHGDRWRVSPPQEPKTSVILATHQRIIMKMYDRQRSMKSFVGLREKTSSEVIYVASPTQAVITKPSLKDRGG